MKNPQDLIRSCTVKSGYLCMSVRIQSAPGRDGRTEYWVTYYQEQAKAGLKPEQIRHSDHFDYHQHRSTPTNWISALREFNRARSAMFQRLYEYEHS